jgi:hypothetical protein
MWDAEMKTFIHQFTNGPLIRLEFDLSKDMPYCESNLKLDEQPVAILKEYRQWLDAVVLPELLKCLTDKQFENFANFGYRKLNQLT